MAESIVGLDLGNAGVKAVHLRRGLMGLEWVGAAQKSWPTPYNPLDRFSWRESSPQSGEDNAPPQEALDALSGVIRELWSGLSVGRARVIVSVPVHLCSIRTITLPFSDERRLMQVVPFEVESQLPLPLEDMVVDHQLLFSENGSSRLLVASVPKETLNRFLTVLSKAGVDPSMVDLDAMALYTLSRYALKDQSPEGTAFIDIGVSTTNVVVMEQNHVRFTRTFLQGSGDWTKALADTFTLSDQDAETRKCRIGMDDGVSSALSGELEGWINELERSLHVAQADCQQPLRRVVLCGGGSRLKGIDRYVQNRLGMVVQPLDPPMLSDKGIPWDSVWSQALGLALKGSGTRQASRVNFRKGEFAYREEIQQNRQRALWFWIGLFALTLLGVADLGLKYRVKASHYAEVKGELRQMFKEMFPQIKTVVDEVHQARTAVENLKSKAVLFGQDRQTVLAILAELTARISKNIKIEVRELVIEPGRVRLTAETESFEVVDRIKAAALKSDFFENGTISNAKILADKNKVRFDLTLGLRKGGSNR